MPHFNTKTPPRTVSTHCKHPPPPRSPFNNASTPSSFSTTPDILPPPNAIAEFVQPRERAIPFPREYQIAALEDLVTRLQQAASYTDKLDTLLGEPDVQAFLSSPSGMTIQPYLASMPPRHAFSVLCIAAIGQEHVLRVLPPPEELQDALDAFADALVSVEVFYDSIGGLAGYQLQCLRLIEEHRCGGSTSSMEDAAPPANVEFMVPSGLDLRADGGKAGNVVAAHGLLGVPQMAEIYPLGGAGDRLGLCCEETGDSLPTAVLPYCGRSLLAVLIRDVQAREYLYYKIFHTQVTTPIAIMTSAVKGNHWRVEKLFEDAKWFGRGRESFRLFKQPLVPVVAAKDGHWLVCNPLRPVMKPGGHGVIWKLMLDSGVFDWFSREGRTAAIVRQISNPMSGQDTTLLALAGEGLRGRHAFGFASCERVVGAAEGMNVLLREEIEGSGGRAVYRITNVEYTEFERLGLEDKGATEESEHSVFPANTNVLYLGLAQVEAKVREGVCSGTTDVILPGMILNLKKECSSRDVDTNRVVTQRAGRLECTMQNLADCFGADSPEELDTFMVYGPRRKVTSSAKRQRSPNSTKIHQTPDGSLYDLLRNAADMMTGAGMAMPELGSVQEYLDSGPGFLFLFHPAMGPLWSVVAQKMRGGRMWPRSEVQLEVAEVDIENLKVDGSLLVVADAVMGHVTNASKKYLRYSEACGRVRMHNVRVQNDGIDWNHPENVYWKHKVHRHQCCRILLRGTSEFVAVGVDLVGNVTYEVPDGYKMIVRGTDDVELIPLENKEIPSWWWQYALDHATGEVGLRLVESSGA